MKNVQLPILYYTVEGQRLKECGIESSDTEIRTLTFYRIDAIAPAYDEEGVSETLIYTGGHVFECPYPVNQVAKLINESLG